MCVYIHRTYIPHHSLAYLVLSHLHTSVYTHITYITYLHMCTHITYIVRISLITYISYLHICTHIHLISTYMHTHHIHRTYIPHHIHLISTHVHTHHIHRTYIPHHSCIPCTCTFFWAEKKNVILMHTPAADAHTHTHTHKHTRTYIHTHIHMQLISIHIFYIYLSSSLHVPPTNVYFSYCIRAVPLPSPTHPPTHTHTHTLSHTHLCQLLQHLYRIDLAYYTPYVPLQGWRPAGVSVLGWCVGCAG